MDFCSLVGSLEASLRLQLQQSFIGQVFCVEHVSLEANSTWKSTSCSGISILSFSSLERFLTWKSTSCSGISILTFSSLNRFLAAMLLYNSSWNGFNVTS